MSTRDCVFCKMVVRCTHKVLFQRELCSLRRKDRNVNPVTWIESGPLLSFSSPKLLDNAMEFWVEWGVYVSAEREEAFTRRNQPKSISENRSCWLLKAMWQMH